METETKSNSLPRRTGRGNYSFPHSKHRMGNSNGNPVHISFLLGGIIGKDGKCDKQNLLKLFNS